MFTFLKLLLKPTKEAVGKSPGKKRFSDRAAMQGFTTAKNQKSKKKRRHKTRR